MANVTTELKVVVRSIGKGEIDKLSASLMKLGEKSIKPVNQDLRNSVAQLKSLSNQSAKTKNNVQGFSTAFKELANNLEFGSFGFKEATAEAKKLDAQLQKMERRQGPSGGRLRAGAQVAGTVAGAGVFGGPEGAVAALAGGLVGGVPGAVVGGAIGAQLGGIREAAGATAEYAANLAKLRIALLGVTTSQAEYQQGLAFIQQTTKDFAIPQEVVTRQFTKLQASVQGAGGNLEDTKTAFNGIVAAVRATGGSLQDVDSALTATAQVFSKGKVSAEELRQQIGERLPGAFTLFAESIGMTPQELDKALEKGQVSLQDFQKFAEAIFKRYGENAKAIADAPESAGDRLQVALQQLSESVGTLLAPIGAAFQTVFTEITKAINIAIKALNRFLGLGQEGLEARIETLGKSIETALANAEYLEGTAMGAQARAEAARLFNERSDLMVQLRQLQTQGVEQPEAGGGLSGITPPPLSGGGGAAAAVDMSKRLADARIAALQETNVLKKAELEFEAKLIEIAESKLLFEQRRVARITAVVELQKVRDRLDKQSFDENQKALIEQIKLEDKLGQEDAKRVVAALKAQDKLNEKMTETEKLSKSIGQAIETGVAGAIEAAIFEAKSLNESLSNILRQVASLLIQFGTKSLFSALPFANGGVFAQNGVVPFARGGVVSKPTLFPFANGVGLMGEAGPEAIMPLRRGPSGRLGVEATGGSSVVVNVDASGSQVQGDGNQAKMLGSAIGAAVQAELVKQSRPGGLLSR